MAMTEDQKLHFEAVHLILNGLHSEGIKAYRKEVVADRNLLQNRAAGFTMMEEHDLIRIRRKEVGRFPNRKFLFVESPAKTIDPLTGFWFSWDFEKNPYEFRLFLGHWSKIANDPSFVAFRFEAPEQGQEHDYFHCQPCRNFGDRDPIPTAALVSEHFPTMPLKASDIVELTICAVKALMGHRKARKFLSQLITDPAAQSCRALADAYTRHFGIKPAIDAAQA